MPDKKPRYFHPNSRCKEYVQDLAVFVLPRIGGADVVKNVAAIIGVLSECYQLLRDTGDADSWIKKRLFYGCPPQKHLDYNRRLEKWASDAFEVIKESDRVTDDGRRAALEKLADLYLEKRRWNNVLNLVALFGVDALRIDPVIEELRRLERQVHAHNLRERRQSRRRFKEFMGSLLPDNRGNRSNTSASSTSKIKLYYYEELFRLYHIENALRTFPGNLRGKVKAASENYELPVDAIKELWRLDDSYTLISRPNSLKWMARVLTDSHFGITQHRLSNILAS